jgi:murein lipoprotein
LQFHEISGGAFLAVKTQKKRIWEMIQSKSRTASIRFVLVLAAAGMSLSACATKSYVDEQIAGVNSRIGSVDAKATDALQRADAAGSAAQAAAADARTANQRLDQLSGRVDRLEQAPVRTPRN